MNHNLQPFLFSSGMNYSNLNYPNMNMAQDQTIRSLEERIYNLETEVMRIKNKLEKIDTLSQSKEENYSLNYQPNSYNMM